jgi:site-specific recombinase XerD
MADYDQEVEQIHTANQPILDDFQAWLERSQLAAKTVKNHRQNIEFFAKYLVYYEPLHKLDEADEGDVYSFLADWYPRKAMWASESNTKAYIASFGKFFKYMVETQRISADTEKEVRETLKENKEEFLNAVQFDTSSGW